MPLTFAHPAAILPLRTSRLPFAALVIGSITPDLIYFVRLAPRGHFGHSLPGLFAFCLPAGLVLFVLWTLALREPLAHLAPEPLWHRLPPFRDPLPSRFGPWVSVSVAIVIGAITHIVWDAFTHADGWGVARISALSDTRSIGGLSVPTYSLAQHGSTVVGFCLMAAVCVRWYRATAPSPKERDLTPPQRYTRISLLVLPALILATLFARTHALGSSAPLRVFAGRFIISATSAMALATFAYAVIWHVRARGRFSD